MNSKKISIIIKRKINIYFKIKFKKKTNRKNIKVQMILINKMINKNQ